MKRRRLVVVIGVTVVVLCAWKAIEYWVISVDRYRPLIAEKLREATGLPVELGPLDLALIPVPNVHAENVVVGEGQFQAVARRITVRARLRSLLRGTVDLTEVLVSGLQVTVPDEAAVLSAKLDAIRKVKSSPRSTTSRVTVGQVRIDRAHLFIGDASEPEAIWSLKIQDVLSPAIAIEGSAKFPRFGEAASAQVVGTIRRPSDGTSPATVEGTIQLSEFQPAGLVPWKACPVLQGGFKVTVSGAVPSDLAFAVAGQFETTDGSRATDRAFAGPITASAWWRNGTLIVNDLNWTAPGAQLRADLNYSADSGFAANIVEARIMANGLDGFSEAQEKGRWRVGSRGDAWFEARDVLLGKAPGAEWRLVSGTIETQGLELLSPGGDKVLTDVRGRGDIEENRIRLSEFVGEGISVEGVLEPHFDDGGMGVALTGTARLSRALVAPFIASPAIKEVSGVVTVSRIAGTFGKGRELPPDFVVEGRLEQGRAVVEFPRFTDTITPVSGEFRTAAGKVAMAILATSARLGELRGEGSLAVTERELSGTVALDVPRAVLPMIAAENSRRALEPALRAYGASTFAVNVRLPSAKDAKVLITAKRQGTPECSGRFALLRDAEGWSLGPADASTTLSASDLLQAAPVPLAAEGPAHVTFLHTPEERRYTVSAELTEAAVAMGDYLRKTAGERLSLRLVGDSSPGNWAPRSLVVVCLSESVEGEFQKGRLAFNDLQLGVQGLSKLFVQPAAAHGTVRGTAMTAPLDMNLSLQNIGFALSPELSVDAINGDVKYDQGRFSCNELVLKGANSQCAVSLQPQGPNWQGRLSGKQVDLNALLAMQNAFRKQRDQEVSEASAETHPFSGTFSAELDRLLYRRATFTNVRAEIEANPAAIVVKSFTARPYSGVASGTATLARAAGGSNSIQGTLEFDSIDARIIDELFFAQPRDLKGTLSGRTSWRATPTTGQPVVNGLDCEAVFAGEDGSLGKLGIATKILAVLRTTEIVRLRMPSLRDEGLTYDRCSGKLSMKQGVLNLHEFGLESTTMNLAAAGTIDFPHAATDLRVLIHPFEAVSGLVERVPVLGEAVGEIRKRGGLLLSVRGSPYDPHVRVEASHLLADTAQEVKETTKSTKETVVDSVKGAAIEAIGNIFK
ncbi:MAG: AsmA-like C-terminal domain-containing protein [Candidatus Hydrogenedentes bacterium]|nr:AsmA-like C-terminal domain-containing protein [Candidatus Hydrogenedentota bacterium]